jgi:hypothetical protein
VREGGGWWHLMDTALQNRIVQTLWPPGASGSGVWAILDAARDEHIYSALMLSRLDYLCLYRGILPEALKRAAPYIVELAPAYTFTRQLIEMCWGKSWGVFVRIKDPRNLRHHLRGFLRVQDESGRRLIFRYYDPRVLRAYLPTCSISELKTVYGPIQSYIAEGERGESMIEFEFDGRRLGEHCTCLAELTKPA